MTFQAVVSLQDSFGRKTSKRIETDATTLANAITYITAYLSELSALTDLECLKVTYRNTETGETFAGEAVSNVDVGATFRLLLDDGKYAAHKIPGFDLDLVGPGGIIDVADVSDYFALFGAGQHLLLNDGNRVANVIFGMLDK